MSHSLGCAFHAAETPLKLRAEPPRDQTVWYVPHAASDDTDWFRDIENTGGVIEQHIGKLPTRCFENDRLQAASIRTAYEDAAQRRAAIPRSHTHGNADDSEREKIARTLFQELNGDGGLPTLRGLQTRLADRLDRLSLDIHGFFLEAVPSRTVYSVRYRVETAESIERLFEQFLEVETRRHRGATGSILHEMVLFNPALEQELELLDVTSERWWWLHVLHIHTIKGCWGPT